jgi:DnaJ-class molecular chaperone
MVKTTTEEIYDVCPLCDGRGTEVCQMLPGQTTTTNMTTTCSRCRGVGQTLVKRIVRTETVDPFEAPR